MKSNKLSGFIKRHKIITTIVALLLLIISYYLIVGIEAYLRTPQIIADIKASSVLQLHWRDLSPEYQHILLKIEDPQFFSHNGIDLTTPGAGYTTITQGLVKIYYFDRFRPGLAKIKQTLIAWIMNRQVDKETQIEIFINTVYLGTLAGKDINGFTQGAKVYFNKDFSALNKDEYLALVAMIVAPNEYNIEQQPQKNNERVKRIKRLLNGECQPQSNSDVFYEQCK